MYITSLMHKGNSFQYLGRYSNNNIYIETLPKVMRVIYYYVDSRAKKFEYETLITFIRTFMEEIIQ